MIQLPRNRRWVTAGTPLLPIIAHYQKFRPERMAEAPAALPVKLKSHRSKRFYVIVIGLVVLSVTPTIVYYAISYNSVNGTHHELVTGSRQVGFSTATFFITIHVWSWAGSLDTQVNSPVFALSVDDLPFGSKVGTSGTFQPNNYISYTLRFQQNDSVIARTVGNSNSNQIALSMSADVSAGWFHQLITRSESTTWTFSV